jgi:hypothetical protein
MRKKTNKSEISIHGDEKIPPIIVPPVGKATILCPIKEVYIYYDVCLNKCDYKKRGVCPKFIKENK